MDMEDIKIKELIYKVQKGEYSSAKEVLSSVLEEKIRSRIREIAAEGEK